MVKEGEIVCAKNVEGEMIFYDNPRHRFSHWVTQDGKNTIEIREQRREDLIQMINTFKAQTQVQF